MLARHETLESLTIASHGEIATEVLEAAATEIWENNSFETMADFEAYDKTWEIVEAYRTATLESVPDGETTLGTRLVVGPTDQLTENPPTT